MFVSRNVFGRYEGVDRALFRALFGGSTKVLPGPPKYLPHQCSHRARLPEIVPEIMPEILPEPPLHSAQIIRSCF